MATKVSGLIVSFTAGADLRNYQYAPVALDTNGNVVLADANARCIGILQNRPNAGQAASVMLYGISKAVAAGAIYVGQPVVAAANGQVQAAGTFHNHGNASSDPPTDQQRVLGFALTAATAAGQVIEILLAPFEF